MIVAGDLDKKAMTESKCKVCQHINNNIFIELDGLKVVRCGKCGLHYVDQNFKLQEISELYTEDMYANYWKYESGFYEKHWQELESREAEIQDDLRKESENIDKYYKNGSLLDLGCFKGHFCRYMMDKGWDAVGVDVSNEAIEFGKKKFGLNLYCGDVSEAGFDEESFDVVTLWGVIEHFTDPNESIRKVYPLLKRDGLLVIKTQNQGSLLTGLAILLNKVTLGKMTSHLNFFYSREHLFRFNPENLCGMLAKQGFRIKEITYDDAYLLKFTADTAKWYMRILIKIIKKLSRAVNKRDKMTVYAVKK